MFLGGDTLPVYKQNDHFNQNLKSLNAKFLDIYPYNRIKKSTVMTHFPQKIIVLVYLLYKCIWYFGRIVY